MAKFLLGPPLSFVSGWMEAIVAKLGSLNLAVKDIEASAQFYAALFGFSEIANHRTDHFRLLDANGVLLGFNDATSSQDYGGPATGGTLLSFDTTSGADLEQLSAKAVQLGATLKSPARPTNFGATEATFTDPEGRPFRILAWS